jgi:1-deoxy-D-xylulose-5-phosphate synthase
LSDHPEYPILFTINSPADVKALRVADLTLLAAELRRFLIETVARTGGHLGGNLGAVELTIALHYIYDTPRDLIIWDVGAQAYPHKILTGRRDRFHTLRQYQGIAPFPRRDESPYDTFGVGHSSTSISAALGMAVARDQRGENHKVLAVIGDGGMTGGLAFEGLNNAGASGRDITVVLNDNSMAISPNVGALSQHLAALRADPRFEKIKDSMWQLAGRLPRGSQLRKALHGVDAGIRAMLIPGIWFERLGFRYIGPIDGHNLPELVRMFEWLRGITGPVLVHVLTEKGKGYKYAEEDRINLHSISKMDPSVGPVKGKKSTPDFSAIFSDELLQIAAVDTRVVAITPAMIEGSKLNKYQETFPDRCFDVGIAEQHAVTFAAGLAAQGMKPVVVIYSTFLQRAYDQVIHDVALQNLPVIFGIDRGGLVGGDGPTHHGAFDLSYLRSIPNMSVLAARDEMQLRLMLRAALEMESGSTAIRFPRGNPESRDLPPFKTSDVWKPVFLRRDLKDKGGVIISLGPIGYECLAAAEELARDEGLNLAVLDLQCVKPLDTEFLTVLASRYPLWMTVEDNALQGGMGSALLEFISDRGLAVRVLRLGLPDRFIAHGERDDLLREIGLDKKSLRQTARIFFGELNTVTTNRRLGNKATER